MPKDVRDKVKWLTDMVSERDRELEEMEKRLEASFEATKRADDLLLEEKIVWKDEKHELKVQIDKLKEDLKYERNRASQALDVAASTSDAAGGIGRLLRSIVDNDVMETLRLASFDQRQEARERMRHRRPV
jgi:hypothetical protein